MKVIIDTKTGEVKVNGKSLKDAPEHYKTIAEFSLRLAYQDNFPMTDYEEDCLWMSYRYCIGRHTIASHMHANDIWRNCRGRMPKDRELFTAYDINREIEDCMRFGSGPQWRFPNTPLNVIYKPAIDLFCEFLEEYEIKSKEDYLKYYSIDVILTDNERGYKFETTTWDEEITSMIPVFKELYYIEAIEDIVKLIKELRQKSTDDVDSRLRWIVRNYPNPEYFYLDNIEDLFVWNDLVHCFDHEHHHKSILTDGTECEWFWSWRHKYEEGKDGYLYRTFGYEKIRVPVYEWNGSISTWIPDESIKEDLY